MAMSHAERIRQESELHRQRVKENRQNKVEDGTAANSIFNQTKRFVWLKLFIGVFNILVVMGLGLVCYFIANAIAPISDFGWVTTYDASGNPTTRPSGGFLTWIGMLLMWIFLSIIVIYLVNIFWRFRIRMGHVAVVTVASLDGKLPDGNPLKFGNEIVKNRMGIFGILGFFMTCNILRTAGRKMAGRVGDAVRGVGTGAVAGAVQMSTRIATRIAIQSATEVSMAWAFYDTKTGPVRATFNGLGLYFRNWKTMLAATVGATFALIVAYVIFYLIAITLVIVAIVTANFWMIFGSIALIMLASTIKSAFLDSYRMCRMVNEFIKVAPSSRMTQTLVRQMQNCSSYRALEERAQAEDKKLGLSRSAVTLAMEETPARATRSRKKAAVEEPQQPDAKFCAQTGQPLEDEKPKPRFCPQTGNPLE
ncbi:MAG: hypothetical protein FWE16_05105 [Firmicutes bacterium]|nr:hypothetical protein [Bacillota bacterium]